MQVKHCVMDLREMIRLLEERRQRNIEAMRTMEREPTPTEEARFEVGCLLMMDLVGDLRSMANGWEDGQPNYRVTERAIKEDP